MVGVTYSIGMTLEQLEKQAIQLAFRFFGGNKTRTAHSLGIAIRTLETKLEKIQNDDKLTIERITADRQDQEAKRLKEREILRNCQGTNDLGREIQKAKEIQNSIYNAHPGNGVEPVKDATAQHAVPVSEREEIQTVLPSKASAGGNAKRR